MGEEEVFVLFALFGLGEREEWVIVVAEVRGSAGVEDGEFDEVFEEDEEGDVGSLFGEVVGLGFFDGVEAEEVEDVGEFVDEEVVGGVEEGFFEEVAVEDVVFVGVGEGEVVVADAAWSVRGWVTAADEVDVDAPLCVVEGAGGVG